MYPIPYVQSSKSHKLTSRNMVRGWVATTHPYQLAQSDLFAQIIYIRFEIRVIVGFYVCTSANVFLCVTSMFE